jgi:hypothetical protein
VSACRSPNADKLARCRDEDAEPNCNEGYEYCAWLVARVDGESADRDESYQPNDDVAEKAANPEPPRMSGSSGKLPHIFRGLRDSDLGRFGIAGDSSFEQWLKAFRLTGNPEQLALRASIIPDYPHDQTNKLREHIRSERRSKVWASTSGDAETTSNGRHKE